MIGDNQKNLLAKKILGKASKKKCMVEKNFQEFFFFLMNGERGCSFELLICDYMERNGAAQSGSET